jgi:hypothetical protein
MGEYPYAVPKISSINMQYAAVVSVYDMLDILFVYSSFAPEVYTSHLLIPYARHSTPSGQLRIFLPMAMSRMALGYG